MSAALSAPPAWLGNNIVGDLVLLPLATATVGWAAVAATVRMRPQLATNAEAEPFPTADNGPMPVRRLATRSRKQPVRLSVDQTASASLEAGADIDPVAVGSASTVKDGGPESWTTEPPPAARSNPALITHRCTGGTTQAGPWRRCWSAPSASSSPCADLPVPYASSGPVKQRVEELLHKGQSLAKCARGWKDRVRSCGRVARRP